MNEGIQTAYDFGGVVSTPAQRNRVLRNTYGGPVGDSTLALQSAASSN